MIVERSIKDFIQYITEAFVRIFSPNDDEYPAIGVQPFEGEVYQSNSGLDW
jgi:hypothetical protein